MPWGGHPWLGRPADYLPPGTVGQWLPAPCNGGPSARAATLEPTRRQRGLTQNSRAGNPKRTRPNCRKNENSQRGWHQSTKGRGPKNPAAQEVEGVAAPLASTWLLRQLLDPEREETQDASGVAQPEVCPHVSHGRLDTGTSALEDTADLDSEVNFHWRHRQDSADGLEYRRLFVPLRKGEILAPEHWQESSLRARADTLRGFFAKGATCSNATFSYYFSLNRRQWIAARSCSRSIGGGQCASVAATSPSSLDMRAFARGGFPLCLTFPFRSQWLRGNPTCRVPVSLRAFDDGVTACDRCLEGSPLVSRSLCHPIWASILRGTGARDSLPHSYSACLRSFSLFPQRVSSL